MVEGVKNVPLRRQTVNYICAKSTVEFFLAMFICENVFIILAQNPPAKKVGGPNMTRIRLYSSWQYVPCGEDVTNIRCV